MGVDEDTLINLVENYIHEEYSYKVNYYNYKIDTHAKLNNYLLNEYKNIYKLISNKFLGKLYSNAYNNWFDIENAYFQELIKLKDKIKLHKENINEVKKENKRTK